MSENQKDIVNRYKVRHILVNQLRSFFAIYASSLGRQNHVTGKAVSIGRCNQACNFISRR